VKITLLVLDVASSDHSSNYTIMCALVALNFFSELSLNQEQIFYFLYREAAFGVREHLAQVLGHRPHVASVQARGASPEHKPPDGSQVIIMYFDLLRRRRQTRARFLQSRCEAQRSAGNPAAKAAAKFMLRPEMRGLGGTSATTAARTRRSRAHALPAE